MSHQGQHKKIKKDVEDEDWYSMSINLAAENDELLAEHNRLADNLIAANEAWQAMSDQNTELRKMIEKSDSDFNEQLDEATKS